MVDQSVADRLRAWREAENISQAKLAASLGLKQPAVAHWETGGRPDLARALELQAHTNGEIPATAWGYTGEQVARVLRAADFPSSPRAVGADHTANDFTVTAPAAPVVRPIGELRVERDSFSQVG